MRLVSVTALLAVATSLFAAEIFWQGKSGDFSISWTIDNIQATQDKSSRFDIRETVTKRWAATAHELSSRPTPPEEYSAEFGYKLLSAIGPVLSLMQAEYCDCGGAHPSEIRRFAAFDLSKSQPAAAVPALLNSYFPEDAIYSALGKDRVIQSMIAGKHPKNFESMMADLRNAEYQKGDCRYSMSSDKLDNFSFYDYRNGIVSVRISLSHSVETCRGEYLQIGIELPVSNGWLKNALAAAKDGKTGVLMKDLELRNRANKEAQTSISFSK